MAEDNLLHNLSRLSTPAQTPQTIMTPSNNDRVEKPVPSTLSARRVLSPLHQSFSSLSMTEQPLPTDLLGDYPSHPSDAPDARSRGNSLTRSSSLPSTRTGPTVKEASSNTQQNLPSRHNTSSVRHLTCFWWKEKGLCRFKDDECLYAHHDTGLYTEPPRQIVPGEPALAGRKLDRAMRSLAAAHRSSTSLSSMAGTRHTSRQGSRPQTPIFEAVPPLVASATHAEVDLSHINADNQFLRRLVDQNVREKAFMVDTIEKLQEENRELKGEIEGLNRAKEQLQTTCDRLRAWSTQREQLQGLSGYDTNRSYGNIGGHLGRARNNTESRFLGRLLDDD